MRLVPVLKFLNNLERRFGRFAIENLMVVICGGQAIVYIADLLMDGFASDMLYLNWGLVTRGQIWRVLTFIFEPGSSNPLTFVLSLYFYYMIGGALERIWGSFNFDCFYLLEMICTVIASVFVGVGTSYYINLSLFLAFAVLYPDHQVLLFYVLPIKVKWVALIDLLFMAYSFYISPSVRPLIIASFVPLVIFLWDDAVKNIRLYIDRKKRAKEFSEYWK